MPRKLVIMMAVFLLFSLSGKLLQIEYSPNIEAAALETRMTGLLTAVNARQVRIDTLSLDGLHHLIAVEAGDCASETKIMITPHWDSISLLKAVMRPDERLYFIYRGRIFDHPPHLRVLADYSFKLMLHRLRLRRDKPDRSIVALVSPAGCDLVHWLPWQRLWPESVPS